MSKEITRQYKKLGIDILTSTRVDTITDHGDRATVTYTSPDGTTHTVDRGGVLMSVGFAPRTTESGLESTGVTLTECGTISADEYTRTHIPHVYAIGDVTAKLQLAHVAEA